MNTFTMPSKVYNFVKYLVLIVLPAVSTLWVIVANAWNWDYMTNVSVTLTAVTAFLGSLVGISSKNFNNSDEKYYGVIEVEATEEGSIIHGQVFNEDPTGGTLNDKNEIVMKVIHR